MPRDTLHILFSGSAAGTLHQVLAAEGSRDEVIALIDPLSIGPIDSLESEDRLEALVRMGVYDRADWDSEPDHSRHFWSRCAEAEAARTLWVSPRSSDELAGFHAYLHRFGHLPCRIIDLGEGGDRLREASGGAAGPWFSLGELSHEPIAALRDVARPLPPEEVESKRRRWETLVRENALLRVAGEDGLRSAPETLVDDALLARCSSEWRRKARVLAELLVGVPETLGFILSDLFLEWRIDTLVAQGVLECRKDPDAGHFSRKAWIRIPVH